MGERSSMSLPEKILRITVPMKRATWFSQSSIQNCITVFLAPSTLESSELEVKLEVTETPDIPPSSEESIQENGNLVVSLFQPQISLETKEETITEYHE